MMLKEDRPVPGRFKIFKLDPVDDARKYHETGELAKKIVADIIFHLHGLLDDEALVFDLQNMDLGLKFINFIVGKVVLGFGIKIHNKFLILKNLSDSTLQNFKSVLAKRRLAMVHIDRKGKWAIIGTVIGQCYRVAIRVLMKHGETTSQQLAQAMNISQRAAQKQLKFLFNKKLITRKKITKSTNRGWEYAYTFFSNKEVKQIQQSI